MPDDEERIARVKDQLLSLGTQLGAYAEDRESDAQEQAETDVGGGHPWLAVHTFLHAFWPEAINPYTTPRLD